MTAGLTRDLAHLQTFRDVPSWFDSTKKGLPATHTHDDVPVELRFASMTALKQYADTVSDHRRQAYVKAVMQWRDALETSELAKSTVSVSPSGGKRTVKVTAFVEHVVNRLETLLAPTSLKPKTTINVYREKLRRAVVGDYYPKFEGVVNAVGVDFASKLRALTWTPEEKKLFNGQVIAPLNHLKKDAGLDEHVRRFFAEHGGAKKKQRTA